MFKTRLSKVLAGLFVFATFMGSGPGMYLVNPSPEDSAPLTLLGMPALYAWAVFWFFVQAAVVVTAYRKLWTQDEEDET